MTKSKIAICAIGLLMLHSRITFAAFNDIGVGARPLGMGGAFVALADDGSAASYNAAGLGYIDTAQLNLTNAQRFKGLIRYNYIGGVVPLGAGGTFGASIGILSEDSDIYQERTITVSYGKAFSQKFALGVNFKSLGTSFDEDNGAVRSNPYFADTSAAAISFDLGGMVKPVTGLTLGFSVENLLPADVSISASAEDDVPTNVRVGLAYSLAAIAESTQQESLREVLKSGLGLIEIAIRDGDRHIHAGAEVWVSRSIGVRAGYAMKSGVNSATGIALGGSARIPISSLNIQLDYAFQVLTGDLEDNTTQRFSLNLIF
ncbi:MAG: PorV/PorQ family protein [Candidatus Poribacteria bacterium]|nr:PorV/PorQ family protein [Candidatus Poribacteria bacterium]